MWQWGDCEVRQGNFCWKCWLFMGWPDTTWLLSSSETVSFAGCACGPCSKGRTFANAVISPNLETTRIAWVPQSSPVADCTAACCDLARCDLAWWFEGRCYLVSCPRPESCEPREVGSVRSYLTFVHRPARGPSRLLRYREMVLRRRSPSGLWGDSPKGLRKDLSPLGPALRLRRASEYPDDYRDPELDPFQPLSKQEPGGSAEYTNWGLFPGGPFAGDNLPWVTEEQEVPEWGPEEEMEYSNDYRDPEQDPFQPLSQQERRGSAEYTDWGPFPSGPSAGDGLPRAAEEQEDPVLHPLNGSARTPAPKRSSESRTSPSWVTDPPSREALGKETVQLQDAPSSDSGEEVGRVAQGGLCVEGLCGREAGGWTHQNVALRASGSQTHLVPLQSFCSIISYLQMVKLNNSSNTRKSRTRELGEPIDSSLFYTEIQILPYILIKFF